VTRLHHDSRSQDFNQGYLSAERFDGFAAWQSIKLSDVKVSDVTPCTTLQMSVATVAIIPKWWKSQSWLSVWCWIYHMTHITPCSASEVQWSSVEHSGLGMYGDEINPWGDRQAVAQLWCRGRAKAWFFFGPGPEGPGGLVMGRKLHNENRCLVQCLGRGETFSQVVLEWKCNSSHHIRDLINLLQKLPICFRTDETVGDESFL